MNNTSQHEEQQNKTNDPNWGTGMLIRPTMQAAYLWDYYGKERVQQAFSDAR